MGVWRSFVAGARGSRACTKGARRAPGVLARAQKGARVLGGNRAVPYLRPPHPRIHRRIVTARRRGSGCAPSHGGTATSASAYPRHGHVTTLPAQPRSSRANELLIRSHASPLTGGVESRCGNRITHLHTARGDEGRVPSKRRDLERDEVITPARRRRGRAPSRAETKKCRRGVRVGPGPAPRIAARGKPGRLDFGEGEGAAFRGQRTYSDESRVPTGVRDPSRQLHASAFRPLAGVPFSSVRNREIFSRPSRFEQGGF